MYHGAIHGHLNFRCTVSVSESFLPSFEQVHSSVLLEQTHLKLTGNFSLCNTLMEKHSVTYLVMVEMLPSQHQGRADPNAYMNTYDTHTHLHIILVWSV